MATSLPLTALGTRPLYPTGRGSLALWSGCWEPRMLVPNTRATANSGGLPQPFPSQTFVSSSLKMGVTRLTCLAGVRVNYCLWSSFESRR